ncbi:MAG: DNA-binding protein [Candidatus Micrarchaeota archaeon]|nr:DNA-binding protein [Candidatus Micrarchaeota archaeon]
MRYTKTVSGDFIIVLEMGEELVSSVARFCAKSRVRNAYFIGLGSVKDPVLAHYRVDRRKYREKQMRGIFELASMVGSVAIYDGEPLVHAHAVVSDSGMRAYAGHLSSAITSATVEIMLRDLKSRKAKKLDKRVGLKLFDLEGRT